MNFKCWCEISIMITKKAFKNSTATINEYKNQWFLNLIVTDIQYTKNSYKKSKIRSKMTSCVDVGLLKQLTNI